MENVLVMWKEFIPVMIKLIAAGKTVGVWYLISIALFPFLQYVFKWTIIFLIVRKVLDTIKYIFEDNSEKTKKNKESSS